MMCYLVVSIELLVWHGLKNIKINDKWQLIPQLCVQNA